VVVILMILFFLALTSWSLCSPYSLLDLSPGTLTL
jgi:hypothetical protein